MSARKNHTTARIVPNWMATSNDAAGVVESEPKTLARGSGAPSSRTGRNSVRPCTTPSSAAASRFTTASTADSIAAAPSRLARAGVATAARLRGAARRLRMIAIADGDEDRRVRAGDDADEHREREAAQHFAAEEEQREHREERRAGRDDRAASVWLTLVLTIAVERLAPHRPLVLTHAVEDDDRVVHRVAGDRQNRGDDVQRQVVAEPGQERRA